MSNYSCMNITIRNWSRCTATVVGVALTVVGEGDVSTVVGVGLLTGEVGDGADVETGAGLEPP